MKKMFFIGCLVLGMFAVQAKDTTPSMKIQADGTGSVSPFALQVHLGEGFGNNMVWSGRITSGGVSGHYALNCRWSLWLGLDYKYRLTKGYYRDSDGEKTPFTSKRHYFCLPFQVEYEGPRWFYLHAGPYVERAYDRWIGANAFEVCVVSGMLGTGAHFRLTENSGLRAGLTFSVGSQLERFKEYVYDKNENTYKDMGLSKNIHVQHLAYFNCIFQVGYLYHF